MRKARPANTPDLKLKDGKFTGTAADHGGSLTVQVECTNNRLQNIQVAKQTESPNVGDQAMKIIPRRIVKHQTLNIDAITGATVTSQAVLNAAYRAVDKAGNAAAWPRLSLL